MGRGNNVRCFVGSALALIGPVMRGHNFQPISDAWTSLYKQLPTDSDRKKMSRLFRWLSAEGISPASLSIEHLERFHKMRLEQALIKDPEAVWTITTRVWNRCAKRIAGWPQVFVERKLRSNTYRLPSSAFPPSLPADIERWCKHVSGADLLEGPVRPLGPVTIKNRTHTLWSFASAIVHSGVDPETLKLVANLVTLDNYKKGLRYLHSERKLGKDSLYQIAFNLKSIAKHWARADEATLRSMGEIVARFASRQVGLTEKNTRRLTPLKDPEIQATLLRLPPKLREDIDRGRIKAHPARVLAQMVAVLEILIMAPLRLKNLAALELDRHIHITATSVLLHIPAGETKNDHPLTYELPEESADLVRWYVTKHRSADPGCRFLFPGKNGKHKGEGTLRTQIMGTIRKFVGIDVNPHLFRHFAAYVHLESSPGEYEVVRRLLGHKRLETTTRFYTGFETASAARLFDAQIIKLRKLDRDRK